MDRDDIVVGSKSIRNPQAKLAESANATAGGSEAAPGNVGHCGAMSQQRCDSGAVPTPQQFVRLVGCRDRKRGQQQS